MKVHFLVRYKEKYMAGLYHRACDTNIFWVIRGRIKKQGSFSRKDVNCGNCERTYIFKQLKGGA